MHTNWFHRLFNPHCPKCEEQDEYEKHCDVCEVLKVELENARLREKQLLDRLLPTETKSNELNEEESKPLPLNNRRYLPFKVRTQMMNALDAKTLEIMQKKQTEMSSPSTAELEKEILEANPEELKVKK